MLAFDALRLGWEILYGVDHKEEQLRRLGELGIDTSQYDKAPYTERDLADHIDFIEEQQERE